MKSFFLSLIMAMSSLVSADPGVPISLWTGAVPGEEGQTIGEEKVEDRNNDGITRTSNVSKPTITFHPAPADKNTGAVVVVAPGGGYGILASKHEIFMFFQLFSTFFNF